MAGLEQTAIERPAFVDAHHHFQDLAHNHYPWLADPDAPPKLEGDLTPIRRDYLPPHYRSDLAPVDLVGSVHIQHGWDPADPVGETRWLERLAETEGLPDAIVVFADLAAPDADAVLERHAVCPRVRGVRQILNWHPDPRFRVAARRDLMVDAGWRRGYQRLRRHNLSFDLQLYWPQMDDARRLAADFPDTLVILDHFGMPIDRSPAGLADWSAAMTRLAEAPNVLVKLSGLGLGCPRWTVADTTPLLMRVVEIFGVARCMLGTNLPVDRLFAPPSQLFEAFDALVSRMSAPERDAIYRGNAMRAYRL